MFIFKQTKRNFREIKKEDIHFIPAHYFYFRLYLATMLLFDPRCVAHLYLLQHYSAILRLLPHNHFWVCLYAVVGVRAGDHLYSQQRTNDKTRENDELKIGLSLNFGCWSVV